MGLFYNNNVAGSGVSKNGPKKKPFFRYWELFANKFWTFFKINLVYFLFCIPIVTFGPATAAMTALMRNIYLERPQFIFHDFWQQFKKNFKQSFIIGMLDIFVIGLSILTFWYYSLHPDMDTGAKVLYVLAIAAQVLFVMMNFYIYPQIVSLNLGMGGIIKNSVILVFVNLWGELITLACFAAYSALVMFFHIFVLTLAPLVPFAWLAFTSVFCCYPAIQKYIINPYYEQRGERNPELPEEDEEEAVFEDMGGKEEPLDLREKDDSKKGGRVGKGAKRGKGKIIR
ncbi:MAG: DUF624 domain-containing protein [Lachnospiraceae bacterium]|nr:DUF624 domain-containing protein [Ruminococcus sp.]MCM1275405.1 DUF624 domain-containing protein [Lachnospiraceae bacterium]